MRKCISPGPRFAGDVERLVAPDQSMERRRGSKQTEPSFVVAATIRVAVRVVRVGTGVHGTALIGPTGHTANRGAVHDASTTESAESTAEA